MVKDQKTGSPRIDVGLTGDSGDRVSLSPDEFIDLIYSGTYRENARVRIKSIGANSRQTSCKIGELELSKALKDELAQRKKSVTESTDELLTYYDNLSSQLKNLEKLSDDDIASALSKGSPKPKKRTVTTYVYERNPFVVIATLRRANGSCERCKSPAPFLRSKDGSPYLEVHHIDMLSNGGKDTLENTIAVCPNCHRELHYGST